MKKIILIAVGIAFILAAGSIFLSSKRDESQIRKNLRSLQELLEKTSGESLIAGFRKAGKVGTFFVDDCRVTVGSPVPDIYGRSELTAVVQQTRKPAREIRVRFLDISVSVSSDRTNASVLMTAAATVYEAGSLRREIEAREVELNWVKANGSWKIKEVRTIETLH